LQTLFQPLCAVAIAASPGFGAVFVAAIAAGMGVLHSHQFEEFLPVRAFLLQWCGAVTHLDPFRRSVVSEAGLFHVVDILVAGDRPATQRAIRDCPQKSLLLPAFDTCLYEVAHGLKIHKMRSGETAESVFPRLFVPKQIKVFNR
jgi:hypothetical protein